MEVILLERIEKLGQMGDIVEVKPGYARNYLLPQKKALRATKDNMSHFETQRAQLEADNLERRGEAEAVAKKLEGLSVTLIRQAGESGQLYGSVTARDVAQSVTESGATIDKKQVEMDKVIKVLGLHEIKVRLHPEVAVTVAVNVARSQEEAQTQARTGHMVSAEEQRAQEEAAVEAVIADVEASEGEQAAADEAEVAAAEAEVAATEAEVAAAEAEVAAAEAEAAAAEESGEDDASKKE